MSTTRPLAALLAVGAACALTVATATPASAASVRVSPSSGLPSSGTTTISISGSGFNPTANNGFGVYVVFGPRTANFAQDANLYGAAKWVHKGGASGGAGQAPMTDAGGFSVTLLVQARYTDGNGKKVDCTATPCYIITMAAHGARDRSQDTFTPVTFKGKSGGSGTGGATNPGGTSGNTGNTNSGTTAGNTPAAKPSTGPVQTGAPATSGATAPDAPAASPLAAVTVSATDTSSPWPFWAAMAVAVAAGLGARRLLRRLPTRG
ncbi:hypothetical protein LO762_07400 [Actinocorallia sp. API 0066]|uniref:hypothetical protein n=1 Tax=Actinocorallia sp. API 0066 TaxID=2896846 RepID=UPI001E3B359A|nr:hypothetical protein [Actinocorallia sp. API 0066]MCD0449015.1 hypothetical protein [Actinocorallia sp. API 0066]